MTEDFTEISAVILKRILNNSQDLSKVDARLTHSFNVCCPIHKERSPSCSVNLQKAVYNCFACGASGSLIKLYKEMTGMSIYKELGIQAQNAPFTAFKKKKEDDSVSFQKAPATHFKWNAENIVSINSNQAAADYVRKRGFTDKVVSSMEMKFALKANAEDTLDSRRISFDERLIIPVYEFEKKSDSLTVKHLLTIEGRDVYGQEAFENKMQSLGKEAFYKKCIYPTGSSSNTLYQWQKLDRNKTLYFTEGLMDVAAMRTSDKMQNSTSVFGSAITERQYYLLSLFKDVVYVINNDKAGWKSLYSMAKHYNDIGKSFRYLVPPHDCKDVNEIIMKCNLTIDQAIEQNWLSYIKEVDISEIKDILANNFGLTNIR